MTKRDLWAILCGANIMALVGAGMSDTVYPLHIGIGNALGALCAFLVMRRL